MHFSEIELKNFRNYKNQKVIFHKKVNLLLGQNAQGKTNLLEALYITSFGKSFRQTNDSDMIKFGEKNAFVRAHAVGENDDITVEIGLVKGGKSIKIDGTPVRKTSELLNHIHVIIFSPDDLRIVKDDPSRRRRFMNRELVQIRPVYFSSLMRYRKVLQQKNALLKNSVPDCGILDVFDEELAIYGADIIRTRASFIEKISLISNGIHSDLTESREDFRVSYKSDIPVSKDKNNQKSVILDILAENRNEDIERRTSCRGPQRDDLDLYINDRNVRKYGSQGQQRTAALSLKLAETAVIKQETGDTPILLLDDVLSELDFDRQKQLINSFNESQIFVTSAEIDRNLIAEIPEYEIFKINNGSVILT
ncbi:MAG: DNA replication/repair protein RecF [Eubacteriales bacterium]|nr:DNA replication/repair protein RecF [Eubacteriales bacterium]